MLVAAAVICLVLTAKLHFHASSLRDIARIVTDNWALSVHVYSMAVARLALTRRSKGQRSRSHGYENHQGPWLPVAAVPL